MKIVTKIKKVISKSKCPHCGKYSISFWKKTKLIDYRFKHKCKNCSHYVRLSYWHVPIFLSEMFLLMFLVYELRMDRLQAYSTGLILIGFIWFIQLPFIPIVKDWKF